MAALFSFDGEPAADFFPGQPDPPPPKRSRVCPAPPAEPSPSALPGDSSPSSFLSSSSSTSFVAAAIDSRSIEEKVVDPRIRLEFGTFYRPKKGRNSLGEDAHFVSQTWRAFGVADGVGSWANRGVDAGMFARQLMHYCRRKIEEFSIYRPSADYLGDILKKALAETTAGGTSTACVGAVDGNLLRVVNIGDSGFAVVRDGAVFFHSPPRQKHFNHPLQIGRAHRAEPVEIAENFAVELLPGDVVVAGTDGLFDNVEDEEIASLVTRLRREGNAGGTAEGMARALAEAAVAAARDSARDSPYAKASRAAGFPCSGGKLDDITVVVMKVEAGEEGDGGSGNDQDEMRRWFYRLLRRQAARG